MERPTTLDEIGLTPLDVEGHEDTLQDWDTLLGFPCEGLVEAWPWKDNKKGFITEAFLGKAEKFLKVIEGAEKARDTLAPVLITGKTGTGKELLAHFIHKGGAEAPFVAVNCGAIPATLMESELFGHEKGAFTGAISRKIGYFERANGGTIFLDEISTLKPDLQVKLLRVLQDKQIKRLGSNERIQLHFRIISATNENLEELIKEERFREDLYYRLCVIHFHMPSLSERKEDIPLLADYFIKKYKEAGAEVTLSDEAAQFMQYYTWPGNIRELENLIQRLLVLGKPVIQRSDIAQMIDKNFGRTTIMKQTKALRGCLEEPERNHILEVLNENGWNIQASAKVLHISRTTLYKKIKTHHLER